MNKSELIATIADRADVSKATAEKVLDALASVTIDAVKAGEDVALPGLGKIVRTERAARTGRNPKTGESVQIPSSVGAKLSLGKSAKDSLN